jgi:monoamine oxidase
MPVSAFLIHSDNWQSPPSLPSPAKPTQVLILGAGMAGLAAGYELMNRGYDVRIIEARETAGGRVQTLRDGFSQGIYADAGATFLPMEHGLTMYYANLMKMDLVEFSGSELPAVYYVKGQRIEYPTKAAVDWPYELTAAERKMGLTSMQQTYGSPPSSLGPPTMSQLDAAEVEIDDTATLNEFMRTQGASAGAIELLDVGFNQLLGDGPSSYSAGMMLISDHYITRNILNGQPDLKRIEGGNDLLPKALAAKLGDRISYSTEVMQIAQDESGARVTCRDKDGQHEVSGDYMICTLPFHVLRDIPVTPAFSTAKTEVVRDLKYTSVTRIFLQMREQFWRQQGLSGLIVSDEPMTMVYPGYNPPSQPGVLGVYMAAGNADRIGALDLDHQIDFALSQIELVYPEVRQYFTAGVSKVWDADPFSKGAYAWFGPAQMASLLPAVTAPEGRIFFAGDHASTLPGWIQGAIASGLRAALNIAAAASK